MRKVIWQLIGIEVFAIFELSLAIQKLQGSALVVLAEFGDTFY